MNRTAFGALIKSLRTEKFNPVAGRSWSQCDLAEVANLTPKIVSDIECGRRVNLDGKTLLTLADAFALNTLERCTFFALATEVDLEDVPVISGEAERHVEALLATLKAMRAPGMLHDSLFNIIGMNSPWMKLHGLCKRYVRQEADESTCLNFLRLLFDPRSPLRNALGSGWETVAVRNVQYFRFLSLAYRHTAYFQSLLDRFVTYPDFKQAWLQAQEADGDLRKMLYSLSYDHCEFGPVRYLTTVNTTVTGEGALHLAVLTPASPDTANLFHTFTEKNDAEVSAFATWPARHGTQ